MKFPIIAVQASALRYQYVVTVYRAELTYTQDGKPAFIMHPHNYFAKYEDEKKVKHLFDHYLQINCLNGQRLIETKGDLLGIYNE